jgi:catechol 2,3-dioxygenase-like lactoylglutathione lyase family enzyme
MLHHVSIPVAPGVLRACEAFYGVLGFAEVEPPPALDERARWLERGRTQVHLILDPEAVPLPGASHFAVVVEDYEGVVARLGELGAEVDRRREHWGAPRAYVRDPAGHRVEIMAWPPGSGPAPGR